MRRTVPVERLEGIDAQSGLTSALAAERTRLYGSNDIVRESERPARDLVPGDLVEVRGGEPFPADGLIVAGENLQADESILSGESLPVSKHPLAAADNRPPTLDVTHWASAGTRLLTGRSRVRIAYTGGETLYGEIVRLALTGTHARTPLQAAIAAAAAGIGSGALSLLFKIRGRDARSTRTIAGESHGAA